MKNRYIEYRSFLFLCCLFPLLASATIYQKVDPHGRRYFSDLPTADSTPFILHPINTYAVSSMQEKQAVAEIRQEAKNHARRFVLKQPRDQENFQNTAAILGVLEMEPAAEEGERMQWWLDGKLAQENTSTQYKIPALDRGEHTLQVLLLDRKNHILMQTEKVTFQVHLFHV